METLPELAAMQQCPDEVLLKVCRLLDFKSLASFRLTAKRLAAIGAEALVSKVRFHCSQDSLQRLNAIANHDVFCKNVETVVFEANILANIGCIHSYSAHYELEHHREERPQPPPRHATDREKRLFERNLAKFQKEIENKYDRYRQVLNDQQDLIKGTTYSEVLGPSIRRFPRLTKIALNTVGRCKHVLSERFLETFAIDCAMPIEGDTKHTKEQLKHILFPQSRPLTNLRELAVHVMSPKFFSDYMPRDMICVAFSNLKVIELGLRLERDEVVTWGDMPADTCYGDLRKGILRDALCAATGLESLTVNFEDYGYHGPCTDMKMILGEHSWPKLNYLDLDCLSTTQDDLLAMLKRQPAIHVFKLGFITLERGSWVDATRRMRRELKLAAFSAQGILEDSEQMYPMHFFDSEAYVDSFLEVTMSDSLDVYVTSRYGSNELDHDDDEEDDLHPLEHDDFGDPEELRMDYGPFSDESTDPPDSDDSEMDCSG
ncbi:uncharacterized protein PV06_03199 [Exophiala oligosperma]|uniref:F-box domain-containing protein n=2 Tax=Chaetothyriales TaxID=34395 RepID=A0A0D2AY44_9EURO|nr:uncharacterized protein PV06_03199 [Exophiala oligosperma]KAJ9642241.1 hypothetical protein H2204_002610 [Knufia peltigerae]KIW44751.1 hypothetical protein PV06_03199 [Exophiala oligosperma]